MFWWPERHPNLQFRRHDLRRLQVQRTHEGQRLRL
jgi:hypothetical protein